MQRRQWEPRKTRMGLEGQLRLRQSRTNWSEVPTWAKVVGGLVAVAIAFAALPLAIAGFGFVILYFLVKLIAKR